MIAAQSQTFGTRFPRVQQILKAIQQTEFKEKQGIPNFQQTLALPLQNFKLGF